MASIREEIDLYSVNRLDTYVTTRCKRYGFTVQHARVLVRAAHGMTNKMIGDDMFIEETTVKTHLAKIAKILNAKDRTHAVHIAWTLGLLVREPAERSPLPAVSVPSFSGRVCPADVLAEALVRLHDAAFDGSVRFDEGNTNSFLSQAQAVLEASYRPLEVCIYCGAYTDAHRVEVAA